MPVAMQKSRVTDTSEAFKSLATGMVIPAPVEHATFTDNFWSVIA